MKNINLGFLGSATLTAFCVDVTKDVARLRAEAIRRGEKVYDDFAEYIRFWIYYSNGTEHHVAPDQMVITDEGNVLIRAGDYLIDILDRNMLSIDFVINLFYSGDETDISAYTEKYCVYASPTADMYNSEGIFSEGIFED